MISVTITREELTSRDACEPSIVFFEWLVDAQDRDDSVYFREWTTLHSIWLAVVRPNDAAWLRSRGLIPQLSGAGLSGASMDAAYYPYGAVPAGWNRDAGGYLRRAT